jgi:hypothetical protein
MREHLPSGRKLMVLELQTRDSRFYEQQLARMHIGTLVSIAGNKATVQLQGRTIEQVIMHGTATPGTAVTVFYSGNYAIAIGKDEAEGGNGGGGAGYLPLTGGTMTGPISLPSANPTVPTQAAHKGYVDSAIAASAATDDAKFLKLTGGTLTGALVLSGAPTQPLHAATKAYVDSFVGTGPFLPLAGGTMTGPIVLSANPSLPMHATPKQYVDLRLPLVGGTMTGFIVLHADPATAMQAATKQYVDTKAPVGGPYLPLSGGTMSGSIAMGGFHITGLPATPVAADQAVSKGHADAIAATRVAKAGDTMSGFLTLHADPTDAMHASTKQYVNARDTATAASVEGWVSDNFSRFWVEPATPTPHDGMIWTDPITGITQIWDEDNDEWIIVGAPHVVDPTEPVSPVDGLFWINPLDEGYTDDPGTLSATGPGGILAFETAADFVNNIGSIDPWYFPNVAPVVNVSPGRWLRVTASTRIQISTPPTDVNDEHEIQLHITYSGAAGLVTAQSVAYSRSGEDRTMNGSLVTLVHTRLFTTEGSGPVTFRAFIEYNEQDGGNIHGSGDQSILVEDIGPVIT